MPYCPSRFATIRRRTIQVKVGDVGVGADNPIRIQSMTTSDTQDVDATVRQSIALAEAGCEIVRITAPNVPAARCLKEIRRRFADAGFGAIPLVADIHFLPAAAMEAVEHVEKVRINPGNYADKKKFAVKEYSDADYDRELQRLYEAFSPLVLRAKELGRALRIGTNHGSLSDRIMNRYGDTPLGMVESALEFLRISRSHGFHDLILSMKASNPKVMIQAYRLLAERMDAEDMHYPLHLGVTEAGDGEDGRIKSAIGIGSLLLDGLGDTIRVSLTEDSVYEIPVARAIADKAMRLWKPLKAAPPREPDRIDPFHFERRTVRSLALGQEAGVGPELPPRVIVRAGDAAVVPEALKQLAEARLKDTPPEGLLVTIENRQALDRLHEALSGRPLPVEFLVLELDPAIEFRDLAPALLAPRGRLVLVRRFAAGESAVLDDWLQRTRGAGHVLAVELPPSAFAEFESVLLQAGDEGTVFTLSQRDTPSPASHAVGDYRLLADHLRRIGSAAPIWIRNTAGNAVHDEPSFLSRLLEASFLTGSLLCDGVGDAVSVETEADAARATRLAYNLLQGAGTRSSKTEFVACPSCGRTLFDLQTTTQRIREKTGHLKGVKIAIMGCIVNGPGEMADADFGYVGGAPGKINLYVGRTCVQYNIPQSIADERLIALIREHGKWVEPEELATR